MLGKQQYIPLKDKVWDLFDTGAMPVSEIDKVLHLPRGRAHDIIIERWCHENEQAKAEAFAEEVLLG